MLTLHIGLPKTATTFLQHVIFRKAVRETDHVFIHRKYSSQYHGLCKQLKKFVRADRADTSALLAPIVISFNPLIDRSTILSDENISIDPHLFWTGEGGSPKDVAERLSRIQDALKAGFRIVIGIRKPDQWLASRYAQSSKKNPGCSQADFEARVASILKNYQADTSYGWLDHDAVSAAFSSIFGAHNVFFYSIERLARSPEQVLSDMGSFAGGLDFVGCYQRALNTSGTVVRNRLATGANAWTLFGEDTRLELTPTTQAMILGRFPGAADCVA